MTVDIKKYADHIEVSTEDVCYAFAPYEGLLASSKDKVDLENFLSRLFTTATHDQSIIVKSEKE